MATHDYDIANQSGAAFRTDLNNALAAIQSNNSNSSSPATTVAYQWWADTTSGTLKIRNSSNNAWVELLQLDGTITLEDGSASTPALANRSDLNTGVFFSAADTFNVATGGVERMELGATTIFNESGADVDFRIEGDTDANLFYVDAGNDRIGIGTNTPNKKLKIDTGTASDGMNISSDELSLTLAVNNTGASFPRTASLSVSRADSGTLPSILLGGQGGIQFAVDINSERMRIDSSGRVLIGTTTEGAAGADEFTIAGTGNTGFTIRSGTTSEGNIFFSDGTSGGDEYRGVIRYAHNGNQFEFFTDGSRHLIIDSIGRFLIGTTTEGNESADDITVATSGNTGITVRTGSANNGSLFFSDASSGAAEYAGFVQYVHASDALIFGTASTERIRIDSSGNLGINGAPSQMGVANADIGITLEATGRMFSSVAGSFSNFTRNSDGAVIQFSRSTSAVGSKSVAANGTTAFNTSSDYRLKENEVAISDGITRLKTLKPYKFNFKVDSSKTYDGFFAHEVSTAVPEAILGTKDAVAVQADVDSGIAKNIGDPIYQGIDQSKLVPLLVAAVKELITKVEALEAA